MLCTKRDPSDRKTSVRALGGAFGKIAEVQRACAPHSYTAGHCEAKSPTTRLRTLAVSAISSYCAREKVYVKIKFEAPMVDALTRRASFRNSHARSTRRVISRRRSRVKADGMLASARCYISV